MDDLNTLFPEKGIFKLRGQDYEISKITLSQMPAANSLAMAAYGAINLDGLSNEVDAAAIATDAIMVLIDDGPLQAKLEKLVKELTGVDGRLFRHLTIDEVVGLMIAIVQHNKDFFVLRLPTALRSSLAKLGQK